MSKLIKLKWLPSSASGLPRSERLGCDYQAYVPDLLQGREIHLTGKTAADVADAERAVERFNQEAKALVNSEAIARLLLRAEAVASSKIEGLEVGGRRLLKEQLIRGLGNGGFDITATEILNNIEAMRWAVERIHSTRAITVDGLLEMHHRLLAGTRLEEHGGKLRSQQNWIGGNSYNPCAAVFVPPPAEYVFELLQDLCAFCNDDSLPTIVQAALAHAQFETIHPFIDGNGRTGRALIHAILRRRGLTQFVSPPISLIFATWSQSYISGLTATRYSGSVTSPEALTGINTWVSFFASATCRAVGDAEQYEQRVTEIEQIWRERIGKIRANSALDRLLGVLPGAPVVTVRSAAQLIQRSEQAVNETIPRLVQAKVLTQTTIGRRNRAFEALDLIHAFTDLERQLASPQGNTRYSPPSRRVPNQK